MFFTDSAVARLRENNFWSIDGTFKVVPNPYEQLLSISYIREHHIHPAVYTILKDKSEQTYTKMLTILTELVGIYSNIIKTDFELASINAFRNFFPEARLSGCLFHLGQSVQRKVSNYGLKSLLRNLVLYVDPLDHYHIIFYTRR